MKRELLSSLFPPAFQRNSRRIFRGSNSVLPPAHTGGWTDGNAGARGFWERVLQRFPDVMWSEVAIVEAFVAFPQLKATELAKATGVPKWIKGSRSASRSVKMSQGVAK